MDERIREVLPLVTKPIRYTGGEYNALLRDPDSARVTWVLAMPEVYELGMSNYGLRILYSIINRLDNAVCERCYAPWPDFGKALQEKGLPLYAQHVDPMDTGTLVDLFRAERDACLLGTDADKKAIKYGCSGFHHKPVPSVAFITTPAP